MERLELDQAKTFIPLKENYGNTEVENASYFTLTPSKLGDGWEDVTYYTAKKKGIYNKKGEGDQWVYVLKNQAQPGLYKVGYTKLTPDERAKQISNATGVPLPLHHALKKYRVNNQREFFQIGLEHIKETVESIGTKFK